MKPTEIELGSTRIRFLNETDTETIIEDLAEGILTIPASPQGSLEQARMAQELGYGSNVALMCREHEIAHTLLAWWLTGKSSPVMVGIATGQHDPQHQWEEGAVLALQRLAQYWNVSLLDVLRKCSHTS